MEKNRNIIIVVLAIVLFVSLYFNFQSKPGVSLSENTRQVQLSDNISKVTNLYNQMSSSLPAHDMYCIPSKKSYCTLEGCKDVEANVFILLGLNKTKDSLFMARCDSKPCDVYDVNLLQSGGFATFETKEPHGLLFRTSDVDKSFIEVVTLGAEAFVSNGYCYKK